MSPEECEEQALAALERAKQAKKSKDALEWLQVAGGWYTVMEAANAPEEPEEEEPAPRPQPASLDGFMRLPSSPDEKIRITIRLAATGHAHVICDPRFKRPAADYARTPSEAAELAMKLLDRIQKRDAPPQSNG